MDDAVADKLDMSCLMRVATYRIKAQAISRPSSIFLLYEKDEKELQGTSQLWCKGSWEFLGIDGGFYWLSYMYILGIHPVNGMRIRVIGSALPLHCFSPLHPSHFTSFSCPHLLS